MFDVYNKCFIKSSNNYRINEINKIRRCAAESNVIFDYYDIGASSTLPISRKTLKHILNHTVTPIKYAELYFKLIQYFECKNVLEIGTSIGINTMYLAAATPQGIVITIEGQKSIYQYASQLFEKHHYHNIEHKFGLFDDVLPEVLTHSDKFDFILIDGNHTYPATIKYFQMLVSHLHENTVIIIDDIYWSKDMTRAWEEIRQNKSVTVSIDLFRCGILLFKRDIKEPYHLKLKY